MKITMVRDQSGSDDGLTLRDFKRGETYTVGADLGGVFVREGWAEEVKPEEPKPVIPPGPTETKPAKGPKERKS